MHTVIETAAYLSSAKAEHLSEAEMNAVVDLIAANPLAGDLIVGSGGCRKVRIAGRGKGKSGGYRVVTYYAGERIPVFLLWTLSKGSRSNFTDHEVGIMRKLTRTLTASLGMRAIG